MGQSLWEGAEDPLPAPLLSGSRLSQHRTESAAHNSIMVPSKY